MTTRNQTSGSPERFVVAVDVVVVTLVEDQLHTLLIHRDETPFKGQWMLPGGTIQGREDLLTASKRVLKDKAGLTGVYLEQLYTYSDPGRDPRDRSISVTHMALVHEDRFRTLKPHRQETILARLLVPWEGEAGGPVQAQSQDGSDLPLAFDHAEMIGLAVKRMRGKLNYTPVGYQLLPEAFTISQLQRVHEGILGRPLNKDSFRRRMLATGELDPIGESQSDVDHRPAALYQFSARSAV
ncbi:NUDIX hydrolase [Geothrix alkalitolerans]|uniref:NUDIX hydrolase n=1 Tax=Geothrix alkalitolerans TaxID=2922724 RepID=UPI001FAED17C|nr:NUDIX domain-containing protein [Geothrix alkalitolerans]